VTLWDIPWLLSGQLAAGWFIRRLQKNCEPP
jgi:hypothetical protein